jgi:hypothetical protein
MMEVLISKYSLGQIVILKTDIDRKERMIVEIRFSLDGGIMYVLSCGTNNSNHYLLELE